MHKKGFMGFLEVLAIVLARNDMVVGVIVMGIKSIMFLIVLGTKVGFQGGGSSF
jgi:hypothetical protein